MPEDVLAIWRRKEEVVWSAEEDEEILELYLQGKGDEEIGDVVKKGKLEFGGKSKADVMARRKELVRESSPLYLKMLGVVGVQKLNGALESALGVKKKYKWM